MSTMRSQDEIRNTVVSLGLPEHPYFMRRTARAMDLLDTGKVNFVGDDIFRIHSQFDDTIYHVELNHGTPGCTCADHQKNPGVLCKHMIAATIYQKQAKPVMMILKTTAGEADDYWRRCWLMAQGNSRPMVYEERDRRLFCNCRAHYEDCEHKQLVIKTVTKELKIVNECLVGFDNNFRNGCRNQQKECGSNEALELQNKLNGHKDSQKNNGNGAKAPSQLDINDPFQESESLDIAQIEGRKNGELVWKLSNGEYVISYKGIMSLSQKHGIEFSDGFNSNTKQVIARARLNGNERVSGKCLVGLTTIPKVMSNQQKKLPIPSQETAIELAKRNAARQLLPYAEIKALEHKAKLNAEFDWQKAQAACLKLVPAHNLSVLIYDLTQAGKLREDNPSHYNRTEWLMIYDYCEKDAKVQAEMDPQGKSLNRWSYNSVVFLEECQKRIYAIRAEKQAEANEQPLQNGNGDNRKLMMDKKLRTWLVEADGTKKPISCREIAEQFDSYEKGIIRRLRAGIDSGADISTVELSS